MKTLCGYCGFYGELIWVHSHYQCPRCHNNIMPCCEGETSEEIEKEEEKKDKKKATDDLNRTPEKGNPNPELP